MYPVLFRIGSFPINSYGLMLAVSFVLGIRLAMVRARRRGLNASGIPDLAVQVMIAAIVGSRAFYVLTHLEQYKDNWLDAFAFWKGLYGLSMLGGVLLALLVGFYSIYRHRWPVWRLADVSIPSFALGIFITRIGCFLNGCCFGTPTTAWPGVQFPRESLPSQALGWPHHIHPTQLYSSLAGLFILAVLLLADRRRSYPGFLFSLFMALYGATRFGLEEFRFFDHQPDLLLGYSHLAGRPGVTDNQLISLVMFLGGIILGAILYRRSSETCSA